MVCCLLMRSCVCVYVHSACFWFGLSMYIYICIYFLLLFKFCINILKLNLLLNICLFFSCFSVFFLLLFVTAYYVWLELISYINLLFLLFCTMIYYFFCLFSMFLFMLRYFLTVNKLRIHCLLLSL